jgi:hypothetical protein
MAVAFGSAGTFRAYASASNVTLVAPSSIANGDLLIAYLAIGGTPAATVTAPGGWTALPGSPSSVTSDASFNVKYFIFYKIAASEAGDYTFTHSTSNICGVVIRYTGVDPYVPFAPTPTVNTGGTDVATATGFTTTVANTLVIFTESDWSDNATNTVVPTGTTPTFTERIDDILLYIADGTLASAGATGDKSHTCNNSTSFANSKWNAFLIGLQTPDADINAWKAAVVAAGGSVSAGRETLVGNLITGLKADGIWSKLDRLWLFAAENTQSALIDLKARATATAVNTPTFTTDRGYATTGSAYLSTYAPPGTGNYTDNSAHIGDWVETATTSNAILMGALGTKQSLLTTLSGNYDVYINDNSGSALASAVAKSNTGFLLGSRTGASTLALYLNGASIATGTNAASTPSLPAIFVGARNNGGTPDAPAPHRSAVASIGGGLTSTEAANYYTRLNTYITAVTGGGATTLTAAAGSYALTGSAAALLRKQVAAAGAYTITGTAAALLRKQVAAAGAYTITGTAAALKRGQVTPAGSYTITGAAANLVATANLVFPAAAGSYTLTGAAAAFQIGGNVVLATDPGAYTLTGTAATFAISDNRVLAAAAGAYALTGSPANFVITAPGVDVIPVGKGDILFSGQNIVISTTGEQPPTQLPGGGGSVPPYIDFGRKKRRRYRALEEIEKRLDERIERLEAESQEKQQKFATVLGSFSTGQTGEFVSEQYENLLRRQAQITALLHEAQKRAEKVRQEKIQLAQLARQAFEERDEEEAIIALLL